MPFTLVGWAEQLDAGASLETLTALEDPHVRVEDEKVMVPALSNLAGAIGIGAAISQAKLEAPSLIRTSPFHIAPLNVAAEPISSPPVIDLFDKPLPLDVAEPLVAYGDNTDTANAQYDVILAWLSDGPIAPVSGEIFTVKATASKTLTPYAWTNAALTFSTRLPAGRYAIVGAKAISDGLIAFRFVVPGLGYRPGALGCDSIADKDFKKFRYGGLGVWCEFEHTTPPTVDFLSASADTSETVYIDLMKVA